MKRIYLLRHGKSDWDSGADTDHDRPLAPRGRLAATTIGRYLTALRQEPDLVLSSSALRALDTARLAHRAGHWSCELEIVPELYATDPVSVLDQIRHQDDSRNRLLLVGHEPTWSTLAGGLIGAAAIKFPTAGLVRVDLPVQHWANVELGRGILIWFVTPKLLDRLGSAEPLDEEISEAETDG